jgi:hypothetical protein
MVWTNNLLSLKVSGLDKQFVKPKDVYGLDKQFVKPIDIHGFGRHLRLGDARQATNIYSNPSTTDSR